MGLGVKNTVVKSQESGFRIEDLGARIKENPCYP